MSKDRHRDAKPWCGRIGGHVNLENGKCPECGWKEKDGIIPDSICEIRKMLEEIEDIRGLEPLEIMAFFALEQNQEMTNILKKMECLLMKVGRLLETDLF